MNRLNPEVFKDIANKGSAYCRNCGTLKIKNRCRQCSRFRTIKNFKYQKNPEGDIRITETGNIYPFPAKKKILRDLKEYNIGAVTNMKGEWMFLQANPENPTQVFLNIKGGTHPVNFRISAYDFEVFYRKWKYLMLNLYGRMPKRPRIRTIDNLIRKHPGLKVFFYPKSHGRPKNKGLEKRVR